MFDIHTHVLPDMDDGSRSAEESAAMLDLLSRNGVRTAAATPHFYAETMTPDSFFKRRREAFEKLNPVLKSCPVKLLPGAEVRYFDGILAMENLRDFSIGGTKLLLLELPFAPWNRRVIQAVMDIHTLGEVSVVLAHIDRYFVFQSDEVWALFAERGVSMQVNAEAFLDWRTRGRALNLLRRGFITFMGSDCHNMKNRAPNIAPAISVIERKLGRHAAEYIMQTEPWEMETNVVL